MRRCGEHRERRLHLTRRMQWQLEEKCVVVLLSSDLKFVFVQVKLPDLALETETHWVHCLRQDMAQQWLVQLPHCWEWELVEELVLVLPRWDLQMLDPGLLLLKVRLESSGGH